VTRVRFEDGTDNQYAFRRRSELSRAPSNADDAVFYRQRGAAFGYLGRFQDAIEDLRRADQLWPQSPATLDWLAYALSSVGKNQEALEELNLDEQVGGPMPDEERRRTSIMMELRQRS
jgi:tetratricopeptide (TPR) repeat protein